MVLPFTTYNGSLAEVILIVLGFIFANTLLLVVIFITPFLAASPYCEVALPSFKTFIDSISLGFILLILSAIFPSTRIKGLSALFLKVTMLNLLVSLFEL